MPRDNPRPPLIAGNWKMHKTLAESRRLAEDIVSSAAGLLGPKGEASAGLRIGLFPSAVSLAAVSGVIGGAPAPSRFMVGAQNMHFETEGAFTGEISASMISGAGGDAVILGHSERRHVFSESDGFVGRKVERALEEGLTPILCVGETIEERDAAQTREVVRRQLTAAVARAGGAERLSRVVIAYEPVWAIGTGRTATPDQAQEVHEFIRGELAGLFRDLGGDGKESQRSLILYGGSVKPENAGPLLSQPDVDGALVGGASLESESFLGICEACLPVS